jgi:hypothetical protein
MPDLPEDEDKDQIGVSLIRTEDLKSERVCY